MTIEELKEQILALQERKKNLAINQKLVEKKSPRLSFWAKDENGRDIYGYVPARAISPCLAIIRAEHEIEKQQYAADREAIESRFLKAMED